MFAEEPRHPAFVRGRSAHKRAGQAMATVRLFSAGGPHPREPGRVGAQGVRLCIAKQNSPALAILR